MIKKIVKSIPFLYKLALFFVNRQPAWIYHTSLNKPFHYRLTNGSEVRLYPKGQIAKGIFSKWFEPDEINQFQRFVKPSMTVVDVGANIGLYSVVASRLVGGSGQVLSFEPSKNTYLLLTDNLKLNNCTNVKSFNIGLGDQPNQELHLRQDSGRGDAERYAVPQGQSPDGTLSNVGEVKTLESIALDTMDNILASNGMQTIDFIKIDTEGFEYFVLKGGRRTIMNNPQCVIFFECTESGCTRAGVSQEEVFDMVKGYGMNIYYWDVNAKKWSDNLSATHDGIGMFWACKNLNQISYVI